MAIQSTIMLNNGTVIPQVGLGVFQTPDGDKTPLLRPADDGGIHHGVDRVGKQGFFVCKNMA